MYTKEKYNKWQNARRAEKLKDNPNAIKCEICGNKYIQVISHVIQRHDMTGREYKKKFGYDVKRGLISEEYRKIKAEPVFTNGTVNDLKLGKKYWFRKGQKGVGKYKRSKQTLERLKKLYLFNKRYSTNK